MTLFGLKCANNRIAAADDRICHKVALTTTYVPTINSQPQNIALFNLIVFVNSMN